MSLNVHQESCSRTGLPEWFRQEIPDPGSLHRLRGLFRAEGLHTVCESAHCPNQGECWGQGVATLMVLGETCTRACRFCAVKNGTPSVVDPLEPQRVAQVVERLGLRYVVITSVTRDDLPDGGAAHFAAIVRRLKETALSPKVELLIPDLKNDRESLKKIVNAGPDVIGHNLETVRRLSGRIRPQAYHDSSLSVLKTLKDLAPQGITKSGLMVGLGETDEEVIEALAELAAVKCDIVTIGQYLAPGRNSRHVPVARFVTPEIFRSYRDEGLSLGLKFVFSAPLVRSSYLAEQGYQACLS